VTVQVKPNDMYDYDNTGEAGNKQPLYYDALLSASGPINNTRQFHGRHVVFHESNRVSVDIFISPPLNAAMNATPSQKQTFPRGKTFTFNRGKLAVRITARSLQGGI